MKIFISMSASKVTEAKKILKSLFPKTEVYRMSKVHSDIFSSDLGPCVTLEETPSKVVKFLKAKGWVPAKVSIKRTRQMYDISVLEALHPAFKDATLSHPDVNVVLNVGYDVLSMDETDEAFTQVTAIV